MADPNNDRPIVEFKYKISPKYAIYAIAGVHGGPTAHGQIVINLFSERSSIPRVVRHQIKTDGALEESPLSIDQEASVIRDVLFGVSMDPSTARSVGEWLIKQSNDLKLAIEKSVPGCKND